MLTHAQEASLVALANENSSSFDDLYSYYFPRIYNYVHYRVDDFHFADDLTSQIFEKLFSRLKYYSPKKAVFSVWIFTIARNTITDYYRSRKRNQNRFLSIESAAELIDSEPGPDDIAALNETQQYLRKALTYLDQREREIIALKFWSGFSNRDIAKIAGISESNTGIIVFRAIRRLRVIMESQGMNLNG